MEEMGLQEYYRKRDFQKTPEPRGEVKKAKGRSFVIQKHAASHLHYDFRLEMEGVLKSWSVPKGPSYDPTVKRLAMMTEDHPVEYGSFEGIIPAGEYGGGTVLLWDQGTWEPLGDPHEMLRKGSFKFLMHGHKLRGKWALFRIKGREKEDRTWLLMKERDEEARPESKGSVVEEEPLSVATGRTLEQIAADKDDVWHSNRAPKEKPAPATRKKKTKAPKREAQGAKTGALPKTVKPQLATLVDAAPESDDWVHEMKFDGYRIVARLEGGKVRLESRNGKDWTAAFPGVVRAVSALPAKAALLDGEVAALLPSGLTSFQALQNAGDGKAQLVYFVFDLLHLDGSDLTGAALLDRKERLKELLEEHLGGTLRYSEHVAGNGPAFLAEACRMGLEGIISKRADAKYTAGRARSWVKVKCHQHQEVVIGGYTSPTGSRVGLGALHVGVPDGEGRLRYAGKVGTGFTDKTLRELHAQLRKLERASSPFADKVPAAGSFWVEPRLVGEVEFGEWTGEGRLRHPTWRGLRPDKSPGDVRREVPKVGEAVEAEPRPARPRRSGEPLPRAKSKAKATRSKQAPATVVEGVEITHPDRVLYPETGLTKEGLAAYYTEIADWVLPHLAGRPTTLVRCPEGLAGQCFYQKHTGYWAPKSLRRIQIQEKTKVGEYLVVDDLAGLVGLVQIGILEIHVWNSRADDLEHPDRLIFDLDPHEDVPWARVAEAAIRLRERLRRLGLESFVKTTGGKGLHVAVPLAGRPTWDDTTEFSAAVAAQMVAERPDAFTDVMTKARRVGKIYVDTLRNTRGATAVCAYSTRAKEAAPVSTPLTWEELAKGATGADFTVQTVRERLRRKRKDPWSGYDDVRQRLTAALKKEVSR
jgi:bifunctional non-homologous end joining protein LigD